MTSDLRIIVHHSSFSLHLKLLGNFDKASALELLQLMKKNALGVQRVFIHTNGLKDIHPSGCNIFANFFSEVNCSSFQLLFTGEHAAKIAPKGGVCL